MGFGTLFIGLFLLLNFVYPGFTDAIAALVILYGAYQLSSVNRAFRLGAIFTAVFCAFGVFELGYEIYDMFFEYGESSAVIVSVISILRYAAIAPLSLFLLLGMRDVANEVKLRALSIKCERVAIMTLPIYALSILFELFGIIGIFGSAVLNISAVFLLVANFTVIVMTLMCTYTCYSRIYMPGKPERDEKKESRFAFVNSMRRHQEEKQREYAEYKLERYKQAQEKKRRKNKK